MGNTQPIIIQETKHFGLAGYPVNGSLSPVLFTAAYPGYPFSYKLFPAQSAHEARTVCEMVGLDGANITSPLKELVIELVEQISPEVKAIQASNTIVKHNKQYTKAYNTDYLGVLESLREFNIELKNKQVLVIGAGGGGKAAVYAMQIVGANATLINRTVEKAHKAAAYLHCEVAEINELEKQVRKSDIIINTLTPEVNIVDTNWLQIGQVVMDASYRGSQLISGAQSVGCTCIDGRYWLLYQGIEAYRLFTGIEPDIAAMRKILKL